MMMMIMRRTTIRRRTTKKTNDKNMEDNNDKGISPLGLAENGNRLLCGPKPLQIAPNGSPFILEVGPFVESNRGDFLLNSFMDRIGSWGSVFLSNRIMEIFCQIASWIALCLGGRSFFRIK